MGQDKTLRELFIYMLISHILPDISTGCKFSTIGVTSIRYASNINYALIYELD